MPVPGVVYEVKFWDKLKALEMLAKWAGLLVEKQGHSGDIVLSWRPRPERGYRSEVAVRTPLLAASNLFNTGQPLARRRRLDGDHEPSASLPSPAHCAWADRRQLRHSQRHEGVAVELHQLTVDGGRS